MPRKKKGKKSRGKASNKSRHHQRISTGSAGGGGGGAKGPSAAPRSGHTLQNRVIRWPGVTRREHRQKSMSIGKLKFNGDKWRVPEEGDVRSFPALQQLHSLIRLLEEDEKPGVSSQLWLLFREVNGGYVDGGYDAEQALHETLNEIGVLMAYFLHFIERRPMPTAVPFDQMAMRFMGVVTEAVKKSDWFVSAGEDLYQPIQLILYYMSQVDSEVVDTFLHSLLHDYEPDLLRTLIEGYLRKMLSIQADTPNNSHQLLLPRFVFHLLSMPAETASFAVQEFIDQAAAVLAPDNFKTLRHGEHKRFLSLLFMTLFQTMEFADGQQELFRYILNYHPNEAVRSSLLKLMTILLAWGLEVSKGEPRAGDVLTQGFNLEPFSRKVIKSTRRRGHDRGQALGLVVAEKMYPRVPELLAAYDDGSAAEGEVRQLVDEAAIAIRHAWTMLSPRDAGLRLMSYSQAVEGAVLAPFFARQAESDRVYDELLDAEMKADERQSERLQELTLQYHSPIPCLVAAATAGGEPDSPEAEAKAEPEVILPPSSAATRFIEFTRLINSIDVETGELLSDQEKMDLFFELLADPVIQQDESVLVLLLSTMGGLPERCLRRVIFDSGLRLYAMMDDLISLLCEYVDKDVFNLDNDEELKKVLARPEVASFLQARYPQRHHLVYTQARQFAAALASGAKGFTSNWKDRFDVLGHAANPMLVSYIKELRYHLIELPSDLHYCRLRVLQMYCGVAAKKRVPSVKKGPTLGELIAATRGEKPQQPLEFVSRRRQQPTKAHRQQSRRRAAAALPAPNFCVVSAAGERLSNANAVALSFRQALDPRVGNNTVCVLVKSSQAIANDPHADLDFLIVVNDLSEVDDIVLLLNVKGFSYTTAVTRDKSDVLFTCLKVTQANVAIDLQFVAAAPGDDPILDRAKENLAKLLPLSTSRTSHLAELILTGEGEEQKLVYKQRLCPASPRAKISPAGNLSVFSTFIDVQQKLAEGLLELETATKKAGPLYLHFISNLCLVLKESLRLLSPSSACKHPVFDVSVRKFLAAGDRLLIRKDLKKALFRDLDERIFQTRPVRLVAVYALVRQLMGSTIIGSANTILCLLLEIASYREIHHLMREQAGGGAGAPGPRLLEGGGGGAAAVGQVLVAASPL